MGVECPQEERIFGLFSDSVAVGKYSSRVVVSKMNAGLSTLITKYVDGTQNSTVRFQC